jgi:hypothetical protein
MNKDKSIDDRSNSVRIQYSTEDKVPSSITIDPMIYKLLNAQFGNGKEWLQNKAKEKRAELLREATRLSESQQLFKRDGKGKSVAITPEEFIRGKISAAVRDEALTEIAKPELLAKSNM